ncbi:MAG: PorT family protein [Dysgonamonadaceae bacterium]|jgi:hypothetical protein|nr:PorT family protein [Dysgonamonadaceae bacterium]
MKKLFILVAICCVAVFSAHAEFKLGVKAGVNLAKAAFDTETIHPDNFTGFQAGLIAEFTLPLIGLGMDVATLYSQQGLKFKGLSLEEKEGALDIPVNFKYKFGLVSDLGAYLTAGPYVSFKLHGDNADVIIDNVFHTFEQKSFGAGLNFGFGIRLGSYIQIGANYQLGLTDNYKAFVNQPDYSSYMPPNDVLNQESKGKIRIWSLSAAFFF